MTKAIIFDCFGVLLTDALSEIVGELRKNDPSKAKRISDLIQSANKGFMDPKESRIAVATELGLSLEEYSNKIRNGEVKNKPLLDYIKVLRNSYKTGLLSNIISGGLEIRFPNNKLEQYFDVVLASGDIGVAKPDMQAFETTANKLGVQSNECIMIDDIPHYVEAAKMTGMKGIVYQDFAQMRTELETLLNSNN